MAQRGSKGIALLILNLGARRGLGSASRPGRFTPGKTRYPLYRRLGGPQGRSGQVRKISPPPGFDPRTVRFVGKGKGHPIQATKGPEGSRGINLLILDLGARRGWWSAPRPGRFTPW
jgi:hypothetical protein